jgi:hypothetical protein
MYWNFPYHQNITLQELRNMPTPVYIIQNTTCRFKERSGVELYEDALLSTLVNKLLACPS